MQVPSVPDSAARGQTATGLPDLAVIIPTLDEAANIPSLIAAIDRACAGIAHEIIVVDDWSRDGTPDAVKAVMARHGHVRLIRRFGRRGLASAVIEGMMASPARVLAVIDADGQHDPAILPRMVAAIRAGDCDVAIGSRYVDGGSTGDWSATRLRASRLATWATTRLLRVSVSDPMSGFFAIRADALETALPRLSTSGFKLLLDILTASPAPLRTREFGYAFRARTAGESKLDGTVVLDFAQLLVRRLIHQNAPVRFLMFGLVGALGLIVHLTILRTGLHLFDLEFRWAQTAAVLGAILFNYTLNNRITFADRRRRGGDWWRGLASFYAICGLGALANVGLGSVVFARNHVWWAAGIAGAIIGSVWNFAVSALLTWRKA